jgi:hypothetical protein
MPSPSREKGIRKAVLLATALLVAALLMVRWLPYLFYELKHIIHDWVAFSFFVFILLVLFVLRQVGRYSKEGARQKRNDAVLKEDDNETEVTETEEPAVDTSDQYYKGQEPPDEQSAASHDDGPGREGNKKKLTETEELTTKAPGRYYETEKRPGEGNAASHDVGEEQEGDETEAKELTTEARGRYYEREKRPGEGSAASHDDGPGREGDKTEAEEPTTEAPGRYYERQERRDLGSAGTHEYICPKCHSNNVIVEEQGPNPVSVDEGFFLLRPLKAMMRSADPDLGNRFCRNCGHKW